MTVRAKAEWFDHVLAAVSRLPPDVRWRVEVGCVEELKPTNCRRCGGTEFKIARKTVSCFTCSTVTGLDTEGIFQSGYVNLGFKRHRLRVLVRPLDGSQQRTLTITLWRSEQAAGLWGTVDRSHHTPPIVFVPHVGWPRPTWGWRVTNAVEEALLRVLGCRQGDRWIWYRPDGTVTFEKDRGEAERLARLEAEAAERRRKIKTRGIVPIDLTPPRPDAEVVAWFEQRAARRRIVPRLVEALRATLPASQHRAVYAAAVDVVRTMTVAPMDQFGPLDPDTRAEVEGAVRARQLALWLRHGESDDELRDLHYEMYLLPLTKRIRWLKGLRWRRCREEYRVERMYDFLLGLETKPR